MQIDTIHFSVLSREQLEQLTVRLQAELEERDEALKKALAKIESLSIQVTSLQKM